MDHVGAWGTTATVSAPFGNAGDGQWLVRAGAGFRDSPGVPRASGVSEPISVDDDLRLNTDVRSIDGFLALRHRAPR